MTIKTIIFDVDGVLFNTDEVYFKFLQQALQHIGKEIDEDFYAQQGYDDCIYELGLSQQQIQDVLKELHENYYNDDILQKVHLKQDVRPVLHQLSATLNMATGSGERESQIKRYLQHFDIAKYFSFIGHGSLVEGKKGNPEYFHTIARHFNVQPEECLHIGDNQHDQHGLAAGVHVAIIPTKYSSHIAFDPRCHTLDSIKDIPDIIRDLSTIKT